MGQNPGKATATDRYQDCQIFLAPKYQNGEKYTKLPQNVPNDHKMFPKGRKIDQMVIKYTKIFHSKTLQNFNQFGNFGLKTNHLATLIGT
jgi:hypothetical protein